MLRLHRGSSDPEKQQQQVDNCCTIATRNVDEDDNDCNDETNKIHTIISSTLTSSSSSSFMTDISSSSGSSTTTKTAAATAAAGSSTNYESTLSSLTSISFVRLCTISVLVVVITTVLFYFVRTNNHGSISYEDEIEQNFIHDKDRSSKVSQIYNDPNHVITLLDMPDLRSELGIDVYKYYQIDYNNTADTTTTTTSLIDAATGGSGTGTSTSTSTNRTVDHIAITREMIADDDDRLLVWEIINRAGLRIDQYVYSALPTWTQVRKLYGDGTSTGSTDSANDNDNNNNNSNDIRPIIIGKETCEAFRTAIPISQRYIGVAGQMNTGTNALSSLLNNNLALPYNVDPQGGILWTVPWYKHSWISMRNKYNYLASPTNHSNVLPITIIRDPYFWMKSMCQSPYTMKWNQSKTHCPNLVDNINHVNRLDKGIHVNIKWGKSFIRTWPSLAHVWSSWYSEYYVSGSNTIQPYQRNNNNNNVNTSTNNDNNTKNRRQQRQNRQLQQHQQRREIIPGLMIRFEDILFHPERVIDEIRDCVGAEWKNDLSSSSTSSTTTTNSDSVDEKDTSSSSSSVFYERMSRHFVYMTEPSKSHAFFLRYKAYQSSMVSAIIKYGSEGLYGTRRIKNMTAADLAFARNYLDETLLNVFHYTHPTTIDT